MSTQSRVPAASANADQGFRYLNKRTGRKVVADFRRLLETGDVGKISPGLYHHLIQYGGHYAHFNLEGFRGDFRGKVTQLADCAMREVRWIGPAYSETGYTDGLSAGQVNEQLASVAAELIDALAEREQAARDAGELRLLEALAEKHGVTVVQPAMAASAANLIAFLTEIGAGLNEQAETLDAANFAEGPSGALRDYASQMIAVSEATDDQGRIAWDALNDQVGIDLVLSRV